MGGENRIGTGCTGQSSGDGHEFLQMELLRLATSLYRARKGFEPDLFA